MPRCALYHCATTCAKEVFVKKALDEKTRDVGMSAEEVPSGETLAEEALTGGAPAEKGRLPKGQAPRECLPEGLKK
jgi:hypothetical protein